MNTQAKNLFTINTSPSKNSGIEGLPIALNDNLSNDEIVDFLKDLSHLPKEFFEFSTHIISDLQFTHELLTEQRELFIRCKNRMLKQLEHAPNQAPTPTDEISELELLLLRLKVAELELNENN